MANSTDSPKQEDAEETQVFESNQHLTWTINDKPPILLCLVLGFQHYLTMFGSTLALPFALANHLCIEEGDFFPITQLLGTIFFVSGIATFCQCTLGVRLPIVQGGTFSFLAPTIALLQQTKFSCQNTPTDGTLMWHRNIREVQGAILLASILQVFVGFTGIVGWLLKFVGPLCIAPTITLVGLSLFEEATYFAQQNWLVSLATFALIALFSQYLVSVSIPIPGIKSRLPIFKLFPVILAILTSWLLCALCTFLGLLSDDPNDPSYHARVDTKVGVIKDSPWIRVPYPFQWGTPTFSTAGTIGMMAGVVASMLESIGDYYACARLSGARKPEIHALNRGILVEGLCCMLAAVFGTGNGTTSYSENVGAIGITKVGSRRVVQWASLMMILMGCLSKFGAVFSTIPSPIIGGVFFCMFGMITGVGLSNIQMVDLRSTRNLFILGISIFGGIAIPKWMQQPETHVDLGHAQLSQIVEVLLSTSMFIGGFTGFILDNTIPGTRQERGLVAWEHSCDGAENKLVDPTYSLPYFFEVLKRLRFLGYLPICPRYVPEDTGSHEEATDENSV